MVKVSVTLYVAFCLGAASCCSGEPTAHKPQQPTADNNGCFSGPGSARYRCAADNSQGQALPAEFVCVRLCRAQQALPPPQARRALQQIAAIAAASGAGSTGSSLAQPGGGSRLVNQASLANTLSTPSATAPATAPGKRRKLQQHGRLRREGVLSSNLQYPAAAYNCTPCYDPVLTCQAVNAVLAGGKGVTFRAILDGYHAGATCASV